MALAVNTGATISDFRAPLQRPPEIAHTTIELTRRGP